MRPNGRSVIWKINKSCICQFSVTGLFLSVDFHGCRNQSGLMGYMTSGTLHLLKWPASRVLWAPFSHHSELEITNVAELHWLCGCFGPQHLQAQYGTESEGAWSSSAAEVPQHRGMWFGHCSGPLWLFLLCTTSTSPGTVFAFLAQTKTEQRGSQFRSKETPLWCVAWNYLLSGFSVLSCGPESSFLLQFLKKPSEVSLGNVALNPFYFSGIPTSACRI